MEVIINGNIAEYKSDFDPVHIHENVKRGWKVSAGDYFKYPVKIDGVDLIEFFIKRFNKKSTEISGYDFLINIKGKKIRGLPVVFDVVHTTEAGRAVIYLVMEYIHGDTLDNLQREGFTFLPSKLGEDLYYGFKSIHDNGFWFPDFDPKNFLRSEQGDFYVIDLDSTYPLTSLPAGAMYGCKDFWAPAYDFYRENPDFKPGEIKKMKGDVLNHLNLIYLMGLYSFYLDEQGVDLSAFSIAGLNTYLREKHKLFSTTMIYCFNKEINLNKITQKVPPFAVFRNFLEIVLFPENIERTISGAEKKPEILSFTANGRATNGLEIVPGKKVELQWATKDTTSIRLLPVNKLLASNGTLDITTFEDTTYSLQVVHKYKTRTERAKKSIDINIYYPELKRPAIQFDITGYQQKALLLENSDYTVNWRVDDAQKIFLDDVEVPNNNSQKFIATDNRTHSLKAINSKNQIIKRSFASIEINTEKRPEINLTVSPLKIKSGESIKLSWNSANGKNICIIQDGITIAYNLQDTGNMELNIGVDKSRPSPYAVHFTASASSNSGMWTSDTPNAEIVNIQKEIPWLWIILSIILIVAVIFFLVQKNAT